MGSRNNNMSKKDIRGIYKELIHHFKINKKDTHILEKRFKELEIDELKKDKLGTAITLLRAVIDSVESYQDKYGIPTELYYSIKELIDG
jgi:hypothetical protein|tara:strand:+ start:211 stop:477 length:267 start_codon:yes stop_codon:yes gene_type:complete